MPGFEVFGKEEKEQVLEVMDKGILFRYEFEKERQGMFKVREFEKQFAKYTGAKYALAVSSGTAALRVALASLGIGPEDEVITQGFTFVATWEAILEAGATPVFVEVDRTLNMDPTDLKKKITPKTKAIIPVHMLGAQVRIQEILDIANSYGIPVIEDTAQACGGHIQKRYLGTFGTIGTFSFDPVKTITTGEGGMLITNDESVYIRASEYHDHGHDHNPNVGRGLEGRNFYGFNFRMMELQGAIGLAQLSKLDDIIATQRKNKKRIKDMLRDVRGITFRELVDPEGDTATFLSFFLPSKEETILFNEGLKEAGRPAIYFFENTWHFYPQWEHLLGGKTLINSGWPFLNPDGSVRLSYKTDALPKTSKLFETLLTFPISIKMTEEDFSAIENAIVRAQKKLLE